MLTANNEVFSVPSSTSLGLVPVDICNYLDVVSSYHPRRQVVLVYVNEHKVKVVLV